MEQLYLVEVLVDKVVVFAKDDETSTGDKKLIVKVKFGPKVQFIIKEGQLLSSENTFADTIKCDDDGRRQWSRTIRVGKSYLFPSYPDTVLMMLSQFPLEIELWNDDDTEVDIFVGIGKLKWDKEFYEYLKETADDCLIHTSLALKQETPLFADCCCKQVGSITFILRLSALGSSIITEFQQPLWDTGIFCFRNNKTPTMIRGKREDPGDDQNFFMVGSVYESVTLEDPNVIKDAKKKIEVCTELDSCGLAHKNREYVCSHENSDDESDRIVYPIEKIRMGDITGPCGNANCPLARKIKNYIRSLEAYKKEIGVIGVPQDIKPNRKVCGACCCKDDTYHRDSCKWFDTEKTKDGQIICKQCGGLAKDKATCDDKNKTSVNEGGGSAAVNYMIGTIRDPELIESMFGKAFVVNSVRSGLCNVEESHEKIQSRPCSGRGSYVHITNSAPDLIESSSHYIRNGCNPLIYNVDVTKEAKGKTTSTFVDEEKECKCDPPKPAPPCKTFDCQCLENIKNLTSRKTHKSYCPRYKHKVTCPVTMLQEEVENNEDDAEEAEPLPYGLPPIKLGPCPVMGRPCSVADGFARMYKTTAITPLPPSYSEAGKVCCSKEYERIKKAVKEYLTAKGNDMRCVNKFNVDTETRCCDKEQVLMSMIGKSCCGTHKISLNEMLNKPADKN